MIPSYNSFFRKTILENISIKWHATIIIYEIYENHFVVNKYSGIRRNI